MVMMINLLPLVLVMICQEQTRYGKPKAFLDHLNY
jgi:hypothetical protein